MAMNGIDIASYQTGIDLTAVPCDFVIVKATEGTGYVNPDFARAYAQAKNAGKCLGIYHYANGGDYQKEADYFLDRIGNRIGEAILCLDWEGKSNPAFGSSDFAWCKSWLDYVYQKTGVRPLLYCSQSVAYRFSNIGNYGLWIAQYADMNATGYQDKPWNEGAYTCVIRQYSSCGRLNGWGGNLDLDKFYGDKDAWNKYAGKGNTTKPAETPKPTVNTPGGSTLDLVVGVMQGKYGDGDNRKNALGTRYEINRIIMAHKDIILPDLLSILIRESSVPADRIRINEIAILSARIRIFDIMHEPCTISLNHISLNPFSAVCFLRSKKNLSIHFSFFLSFMYFKISFFTILAYFGYSHPNIAHP